MTIPMNDIAAQLATIRPAIDKRIAAALDHGRFINGPEVGQVEAALAKFCGAGHCVTCANGTDALILSLLALGIGPGDHVICPAFTFVATAEAIAAVGAVPVFADSDPDDFNISVASVGRCLDMLSKAGTPARALIPVDLFGLPARYDQLSKLAEENGIPIICDAAQSFGATRFGQRVGQFGTVTATSFFPSKPLGCFGDGGALFTEDPDLAARLQSLRTHGSGHHKYHHVSVGRNSRLDTIQAAILLEKVAHFQTDIALRNKAAQTYSGLLDGRFRGQKIDGDASSTWAQFAIRFDNQDHRHMAQNALSADGIAHDVHYETPMHRQPAYAGHPTDPAGLGVAEQLSETLLSIPFFPGIQRTSQTRVIDILTQNALGLAA